VPLWTAQLKASCVGVILIDCAILRSAGSLVTFSFLALLMVRGPQAVMWMFWVTVNILNKRNEEGDIDLLLTNTTPAALSLGSMGVLVSDSQQESFLRWWLC
jgi:hypothetical protein